MAEVVSSTDSVDNMLDALDIRKQQTRQYVMAAMILQTNLQTTVHQRSVTRDGIDSATLYVCDLSGQSKDTEHTSHA